MQYRITCPVNGNRLNCEFHSNLKFSSNNVGSLTVTLKDICYALFKCFYGNQQSILRKAQQLYQAYLNRSYRALSWRDKQLFVAIMTFLALRNNFNCNYLMMDNTRANDRHYIAFNVQNDDYYHYVIRAYPNLDFGLIAVNNYPAIYNSAVDKRYVATFNVRMGILELLDPPNDATECLDIDALIDANYKKIKKIFCHNREITYNNHEYCVVNMGEGLLCGIDERLFRADRITKELLSQMDHVYEDNLLISAGIYVYVPNGESLNDN